MKRILNLIVLLIVAFAAWNYFGATEKAEVPTETEDYEHSVDTTVPEGSTHVLDVEQSSMKWTGAKKIGSEHFGSVDFVMGSLAVGEETTGLFVVDMNSIQTEDLEGDSAKSLDEHLKNEDFFHVEKYPHARLMLTSIAPAFSADVTDYDVRGKLLITGTTREIGFPATVEHLDEGFRVKAKLGIDRTLWGIKYGSGKFFKGLGDKVINDEMLFDLDVVFTEK